MLTAACLHDRSVHSVQTIAEVTLSVENVRIHSSNFHKRILSLLSEIDNPDRGVLLPYHAAISPSLFLHRRCLGTSKGNNKQHLAPPYVIVAI